MIMEEFDPKPQGPIKFPLPRLPSVDLTHPSIHDVFSLALRRVVDVVKRNQDDPPSLLFPTAEHTQIMFFSADIWEEFGNMETEISRLRFTLSRYPERGLPLACSATIQGLLREDSMLNRWPEVVGCLRAEAHGSMKHAPGQMAAQPPSEELRQTKQAFLTRPVDYTVCDKTSEFQLSLWNRSLAEIAELLRNGDLGRAEEFLQIHGFLRDPIGGLKATFDGQISWFSALVTAFRQATENEVLSLEDWQGVAAQSALESSFLAIPELQNVAYIHFSHHQELPYVYIPLDILPRAEFSIPRRVLEIAYELVSGSSKGNLCQIAPITTAYAAPLEHHGEPFKIIIDGNNRVTALFLLKFLAASNLRDLNDVVALESYCRLRRLGAKWLVDIRDVVDELNQDPHLLQFFIGKRDVIEGFGAVTQIPALVVQEQSFHTLCISRLSGPRPVLLQPMHQTLYNESSLFFAFPAQRGQAHGRSLSFRPLPLR